MRKTAKYTVPAPGPDDPPNRDAGKTFLLREMPAMQAEKWAMRAFSLVARSGADIGGLAGAGPGGMAEVALLGVQALMGIRFEDAEPLLDEMMTCVSILPDPAHPEVQRPLIGDDDIEEPQTILMLRSEVFKLHTGFSLADAARRSSSPAMPESA